MDGPSYFLIRRFLHAVHSTALLQKISVYRRRLSRYMLRGMADPDRSCISAEIQKNKGPAGKPAKKRDHLKEGCFRRYGGRCAFLNDDNLCDLYLEGGGEKAFCRTCRIYPRHIEEFEGLREISLSLSCPVAASLILSCREQVHFLHGEDPDRDETYEDFDFLLFTKLMDGRTLILDIIQNRSRPIGLRAAIALALAHDLQERIDRNALFDVDSLLESILLKAPGIGLKTAENAERQSTEQRGCEGSSFCDPGSSGSIRENWKPYLHKARITLKNTERNAAEKLSGLFTDIITEQLIAICYYP